MPDYAEINEAALAGWDTAIHAILPGGRLTGNEYTALNPTRDDKRAGSFRVNNQSGAWADFSSGDRGGDLISLYAYINSVSQSDAARNLAEIVGSAPLATPAQRKKQISNQRWTAILPVPDDAGDPPLKHFRYGAPVARYRYRDLERRLLGYTCRLESPEGKVVLPLTYCRSESSGRQEWRWQTWPRPRPLFGLDGIAMCPEAKILIVEGEKCRNVAGKLFAEWLHDIVPIAWVGGTNGIEYVDWKPLSGRMCILWPDSDSELIRDTLISKPPHDQAGLKCMIEVAAILAKLDCKVRVLNVYDK